MVADGGAPIPLTDFQGQAISLHHRHDDWGDTPRTIGAASAFAQGYDAVCWLDQDNWLYPKYAETLAAAMQKTRCALATCSRDIYTLSTEKMGLCKETDGQKFVDANCMMLSRAASSAAMIWATMPKPWHVCSDMYFLAACRRLNLSQAHCAEALMGYRATRTHTYALYGRTPPPEAKDSNAIWQGLTAQEAVRSNAVGT